MVTDTSDFCLSKFSQVNSASTKRIFLFISSKFISFRRNEYLHFNHSWEIGIKLLLLISETGSMFRSVFPLNFIATVVVSKLMTCFHFHISCEKEIELSAAIWEWFKDSLVLICIPPFATCKKYSPFECHFPIFFGINFFYLVNLMLQNRFSISVDLRRLGMAAFVRKKRVRAGPIWHFKISS